MVFPLEQLEPAIQERASTWAALELRQRVRPVDSNHGKPVTGAEFESSIWLVEVTIWSSGEADVATVRLTDDRVVNTHYELADRNDLDGCSTSSSDCSLTTSSVNSLRLPVAGYAELRQTTRLQSFRDEAGGRPLKGRESRPDQCEVRDAAWR